MDLRTYYIVIKFLQDGKDFKEEILRSSTNLSDVSSMMFPGVAENLEFRLQETRKRFASHCSYYDKSHNPTYGLFNHRFDARFFYTVYDNISLIKVRLFTDLSTEVQTALKWGKYSSQDPEIPPEYVARMNRIRREYEVFNEKVQVKRLEYLDRAGVLEYTSDSENDW